MAQVEKIVAGVDGIVHLGGYSIEGPWETILQRQHHRLLQPVRGGLPRRRQARGVRLLQPRGRLLSAQPEHRRRRAGAAGFSRYGVSKAFGEALGALYADKHGLSRHLPAHRQCRRRAARPAAAGDLAQAGGPGAADPHRARASRHPFEIFYGASDNEAAWWDNSNARRFGYKPHRQGRGLPRRRPWRRRPNCRPIRSATAIRAARFAATNTTPTASRRLYRRDGRIATNRR